MDKQKYEKPEILATYSENELIGSKGEETFEPQWSVEGSVTYTW
jgi:hypothetical protein